MREGAEVIIPQSVSSYIDFHGNHCTHVLRILTVFFQPLQIENNAGRSSTTATVLLRDAAPVSIPVYKADDGGIYPCRSPQKSSEVLSQSKSRLRQNETHCKFWVGMLRSFT